MKPLRRVLAEQGTPYLRLSLAGLLGLASAAATIGLLAGSGYVIGRAALRPGLDALVGVLAATEVLAFLRGPLRYAERLVGHDAALRALARWRVWLYDQLTPRVPAALAGWRSGDLLSRAIDDIETLGDLYLRTLLPIGIAVGAAALGLIVVGLVLPAAALALGVPLVFACVVPPLIVWHGSAYAEAAEQAGALSAQVVDAISGAPDLLAFGAEQAMLTRIARMGDGADALARREARAGTLAALVAQLSTGAALVAVLATSVAAVHAHHLNPVMVAVLPLTALGTFEPVPGLIMAVSRALAVRAAASRLQDLEEIPVPVRDPDTPEPLPAGVPDVSFDGASLRYASELPRALDEVTFTLAPGSRVALTGSSGAGKSSVVQRAVALLAPGERHIVPGRNGGRTPGFGGRPRLMRPGRPTRPALRRVGALECHARSTRRLRRRHHRRARDGAARRLGARPAGRSRHAGRRRRRHALGRREAPTGCRPGPARRRPHPHPR